MIADAQLDARTTRATGNAVIAFMNPGGIRADLLYAAVPSAEGDGNVTYGEMFTVQPFGNIMITMPMTGAQIDRLLEEQFAPCRFTSNRILQVSDGLHVHLEAPSAARATRSIRYDDQARTAWRS